MFLRKNRTLLLVVVLLTILTIFSACAEKEKNSQLIEYDPPIMATTPNHAFSMPTASTNLSSFTSADIAYHDQTETVVGYILDQFIRKSKTDSLVFLRSQDSALETRDLFTYRMKALDGWNPWNNGNSKIDVHFDFLKSGYFVPSKESGRTYHIDWYSDANLKTYCVKGMTGGSIEIYRAIIVEDPAGNETFFEINILPVVKVKDSTDEFVDGIKLSGFITGYITETPERYSYYMTALDGQSNTVFTWADMQAGSLILGEDRTFVPDKASPGQYRIRYLKKIRVGV